ncbi:uncharacterized protein DUF4192 [Leucobacter komagatae]|uniref:Uncharacterized protein DUF4192 n=1 Tax=Leucobacter komagatae TaxID=55969 RepID=A0A542XXX4_9MICO|nr:DUF4192 family protein [Leucobacter komagatae]TQL40692.1 uncharacterized protein DUF4192 [Leucobacter komagatae]
MHRSQATPVPFSSHNRGPALRALPLPHEPAGQATSEPPAAPDPVELIRCDTTADFLAALPRLVGFTAPDSLFVVLFSGARAHGALRIDLPDSDEAAAPLDEYVTELVSYLQHTMGRTLAGSPAVVIASSLSFADAGGFPWRQLALKLDQRFAAEGVTPRELCCVAPDGWASLYDTAAPVGGYPISMIERSAAATSERFPTLTELGKFRRVPRAERAAVERAITAEQSKRDHPSSRAREHVDASVTGSRERRFELGRKRLEALFTAAELSHVEAAGLVCELSTDVGWACVFDELSAAAAAVHAGNAEAAEYRPAIARLVAASERLAFLAPLTPPGNRPAVIALSALAWWLRGFESVARRHIDEALRLAPSHSVASLAREVIDGGSFPMTMRGNR